MKERWKLLMIVLIFMGAYYIPWSSPVIRRSGLEAFMMLQEYARDHVLTCLIPAFFIAGAIAVFVSQASVLKYFGATAKKILSYSVASVSGTVLAVCSCTVLPLFAGIYTRGAGIGPATAFLYSGPAINVLAIVLTARILGWQLGLARAIGAVLFAVITGLLMAFIFRKDDAARAQGELFLPEDEATGRTLAPGRPVHADHGADPDFCGICQTRRGIHRTVAVTIFAAKWYVTAGLLIVLGFDAQKMVRQGGAGDLGAVHLGLHETDLSPAGSRGSGGGIHAGKTRACGPHSRSVYRKSGGWKLPLGQSLRIGVRCAHVLCNPYGSAHPSGTSGSRHGKGPALSLMLAGPALSLPNMLVIGGVMGAKKTAVFCGIIVILSTIAGMIYGAIAT
jgi:uncharacterized membrane protein YraQ (UPF0718 family)